MGRAGSKTIAGWIPVAFLATLLCPDLLFAQSCDPWIGKAVSVQGTVQCLRTGETQWRPVQINDTYCPGDTVRVLRLSRLDIVLRNEATLRLDQNTTITFSQPEEEKTLLIKLIQGVSYFFSRISRGLKILTPFVNATVEGTEFLVNVEGGRTVVTVLDGAVSAQNEAGRLTVGKGQSAVAEAGRAPVGQILVRPRDAIQWTLYYPPTVSFPSNDFEEGPAGSWQAFVRASIELYRAGDLPNAIDVLENVTGDIRDARFYTYRASLLLSVGRVQEAISDLEGAQRVSPADSRALALASVVALVQNEKGKALDLARKAVESDDRSAGARIALSYALQSDFDLKGAKDSLEAAVRLEPDNALAWARLAELWLSFGELDKGLESASRAAALDPGLSRTQTVLGFAFLTQIKTKLSKNAFEKAIKLDQADPLPRLGLGLAKIREGDLAEGREEIEIAASLDPNNALIRSYLGKGFYEEKREKLASNQFVLAKELDPSDPTAYFYDAILKQSANRPVEALHDMQEAISLNDNRAVYRSRLLLDSDLAARSASLARIYRDLGFQQLALVEGWKSLNADPSNFSAHRFLAESYLALPRHEISRVSEVLQSQLLQPITINPVPPLLAESNLQGLTVAGPSRASFNEYDPLFNRNRLALQASGIAGGRETWGDEILQSGVLGRFSYSLGQLHFKTDGFRQNNDLEENIYDVYLQGMLSYKTSLMADFRSTEREYGDLELRFFNFVHPHLRNDDDSQTLRLGLHHALNPSSDIVATFVFRDRDYKLKDLFPGLEFTNERDEDSLGGEVQYLFRLPHFNLVGGTGYFRTEQKNVIEVSRLFKKSTIHQANLYAYPQMNLFRTLTVTAGGSVDFSQGDLVGRRQFNPKGGVTWNPFPGTTLRAAVFRALKRRLLADQTIEPTQVSGFTQYYDDDALAKSWNYGAAIDQRISRGLYAGGEVLRRDLETIREKIVGSTISGRKYDWRETQGRGYLYWTPHPWLSLTGEYQYEKLHREGGDSAGIWSVRTHRFPVGINVYHPCGLSANVKTTYVFQEGSFSTGKTNLKGNDIPGNGEDQFWTLDASLTYRLPKRLGLISVGAKNLFDHSFRFQESDRNTPSIAPGRLLFGKITLTF